MIKLIFSFRLPLICMAVALLTGCDKSEKEATDPKAIFAEAAEAGALSSDSLKEISGIAVSRTKVDMLFMHNDSGDKNRIFGVSKNGSLLHTWYVPGAVNRDWEDMAIAPGPADDKSYLYICDCGDNNGVEDIKMIYRFPEPLVSQPVSGVETIRFRFPDGKFDSETMLVDPLTKDIYVITKRHVNVLIYVARYPQSTTNVITLENVGRLPFSFAVGGDISPDGKEILIKTYDKVYYWRRQGSESIADALKMPSQEAPYKAEVQGEAIAWEGNSEKTGGYYTAGERVNNSPVKLYYYARK